MKYQFIISHNFTNTPTESFNFQRYFFNEDEHLRHQGGEDCYTFYYQNLENQTIDIRFSVIIQGKTAYSPLRATFGGIEFTDDIVEKDLFEFLKEVVSYLSNLSINEIIINFYPEGYHTAYQNKLLESCLYKFNFQIKFTEHNYELPITEKTFRETVTKTRTRQLLNSHSRKGYTFHQEFHPNFEQIHTFIARSRERKKRPMTMSLTQLKEHFKKFPQKFQLFSVTNSNVLVAVGITININENILYTFYLADDEEHLKDSPTTFLLSGIYEYAKEQNFRILDLGIATNRGVLNEGLARYKRSIGGNISVKKTYFLFF